MSKNSSLLSHWALEESTAFFKCLIDNTIRMRLATGQGDNIEEFKKSIPGVKRNTGKSREVGGP